MPAVVVVEGWVGPTSGPQEECSGADTGGLGWMNLRPTDSVLWHGLGESQPEQACSQLPTTMVHTGTGVVGRNRVIPRPPAECLGWGQQQLHYGPAPGKGEVVFSGSSYM